jgi:hypothetical protein
MGPLRLIYIPNKLFVTGDAAATVGKIAAHPWLFRLGILADLICAVVLVYLVLALYRLFGGVDQKLAIQVVIFGGIMPALMSLVSVVVDIAVLAFIRGEAFLAAFDKPQRDALTMLLLNLRDHQYTAAEVLWGVWLLPLGALAYKSRFLPRFLGIWLVLGGISYLVLSFTGVAFPAYQDKVFSMSQPAMFSELAFMLWLVIRGAKPQVLGFEQMAVR